MSTEIRFSRGFEFAKVEYPREEVRGDKAPPSAPSCPALRLACDSISASLSKCGFFNTLGDGKFYLGLLYDKHITIYRPDDPCGDLLCDHTYTSEYDPATCLLSCISDSGVRIHNGGSGGCHVDTTFTAHCGPVGGFDCTGSYPACNFLPGTSVSGTTVTNEYYCFDGCTSADNNCEHGITTSTYSDEYTTGDLISNTIAALPPYCGVYGCSGREECDEVGQDCLCSSYRNLSVDESSYTIRRFKYKILFTASDTYDLDITWCERFIPELDDGSGPDTNPAHWTYTSKEFYSTNGGPDDTDVYEVTEPDTDGTIDIVSIRCCLIDPMTGMPPEGVTCEDPSCP